jgi:hypothetical protein
VAPPRLELPAAVGDRADVLQHVAEAPRRGTRRGARGHAVDRHGDGLDEVRRPLVEAGHVQREAPAEQQVGARLDARLRLGGEGERRTRVRGRRGGHAPEPAHRAGERARRPDAAAVRGAQLHGERVAARAERPRDVAHEARAEHRQRGVLRRAEAAAVALEAQPRGGEGEVAPPRRALRDEPVVLHHSSCRTAARARPGRRARAGP